MEMSTNAQNAPRNPLALKKAGNSLILTIATTFFCLIFNTLLAQSYNEIPVETYGFAVQSPSGYLQNGEKATIHFEIGSNALPVADAAGYELHVKLGSQAIYENSAAEGWISAAGGKLNVAYNEANHELVLSFDANASQDGFGKVLALELKANGANADASKLVSSATGLMIIDNLDARYAQSQSATKVQVFPNPFHDRLQVQTGDKALKSMSIWNLQGQLVAEFSAANDLDLGHLPSGSYLLRMQMENGEIIQERIQKQ